MLLQGNGECPKSKLPFCYHRDRSIHIERADVKPSVYINWSMCTTISMHVTIGSGAPTSEPVWPVFRQLFTTCGDDFQPKWPIFLVCFYKRSFFSWKYFWATFNGRWATFYSSLLFTLIRASLPLTNERRDQFGFSTKLPVANNIYSTYTFPRIDRQMCLSIRPTEWVLASVWPDV